MSQSYQSSHNPNSAVKAGKSYTHPSEQESFWQGEFGDVYTERNQVTPEARRPYFEYVLGKTQNVQSVCELGANRGHNLLALQQVNPSLKLTGVEINPTAYKELSSHDGVNGYLSSIQAYQPTKTYDLVYTCGVLIHLNPDDLPSVYRKMYDASARYVLINEYYNPTPVELTYREHRDRLYKRDFGGEYMDAVEAYGGRVRLVDYGFLWQRVEPAWDNTTWWLFEKY